MSAASSLAPCLCRSEYVQCQALAASEERTLLQSQRLEDDPFVSTQFQPGPTKAGQLALKDSGYEVTRRLGRQNNISTL